MSTPLTKKIGRVYDWPMGRHSLLDDQREKVLADLVAGMSHRDLAKKYGVSTATIGVTLDRWGLEVELQQAGKRWARRRIREIPKAGHRWGKVVSPWGERVKPS